MYYVIDYDTRTVESKSKSLTLLEKYVTENNLEAAVAIVTEEDELCLCFSLKEMSELYANLSGSARHFSSDDDAAEALWTALEHGQEQFPDFTPALGKRLLKAANKEQSKPDTGKRKPEAQPGTTPKPKKARERSKVKSDSKLSLGDNTPKENTLHRIMYDYVDENFGEAGYDDLITHFSKEQNCTNSKASGYIKGAIRRGYLTVQEEDL